jgi:hypothetical protein
MKLQFIPEELITELDKKGKEINLILIPENVLCEHLFLVEIDQNFRVSNTYNVGDLLATEALKAAEEMKSAEEILSTVQKIDEVDYEGIFETFISSWCNTISIKNEISSGKMQNIMYLYKDLVSGVSQIVKDEIFFLLTQFERNYNEILKKNLENLRVCIPPSVVDQIIERLYSNGLEILTQFYSAQIIFIEQPFVEALKEISESDNDDLQQICTDINIRLAETVTEQFTKLQPQLIEIKFRIYRSLEKFQLQIIPKSVDLTISNIFSESLNKISEKLQNWANDWIA